MSQKSKPLFCSESHQVRPGVTRTFQFSRSTDGQPILNILVNGQEHDTLIFTNREFNEFVDAAERNRV